LARILICDDSLSMCTKINDILERAGHKIVGKTADAERAVELYEEHKPDVVTMDIIMNPPGNYAIKRIKRIDSKAKIVIVSVLSPGIIDAIQLGALGMVTKPIKEEVLLSEVDRVFKKQIREEE